MQLGVRNRRRAIVERLDNETEAYQETSTSAFRFSTEPNMGLTTALTSYSIKQKSLTNGRTLQEEAAARKIPYLVDMFLSASRMSLFS